MLGNLAGLGKRGIMCGSQGSKLAASVQPSEPIAGWRRAIAALTDHHKRSSDEEVPAEAGCCEPAALIDDVAGVKPVQPAPAESPAEQGRGTGQARDPSNTQALDRAPRPG